MVVAFSACQQHTLESEIQQNGIYTLIGKMSGGEAMSRAQIVLDNTDVGKESFMWNDGDAFTLYQEIDGTYTEHVYQISDYSEEGEGDKCGDKEQTQDCCRVTGFSRLWAQF